MPTLTSSYWRPLGVFVIFMSPFSAPAAGVDLASCATTFAARSAAATAAERSSELFLIIVCESFLAR